MWAARASASPRTAAKSSASALRIINSSLTRSGSSFAGHKASTPRRDRQLRRLRTRFSIDGGQRAARRPKPAGRPSSLDPCLEDMPTRASFGSASHPSPPDARLPLRRRAAIPPQTETAPLPTPFWCMHTVDRPTLPGTDGCDPLWHCWRGKPARDPGRKLMPRPPRQHFDLSQRQPFCISTDDVALDDEPGAAMSAVGESRYRANSPG